MYIMFESESYTFIASNDLALLGCIWSQSRLETMHRTLCISRRICQHCVERCRRDPTIKAPVCKLVRENVPFVIPQMRRN